ncbi:MAG: hypothetical protein HN742_32720 [Lentisphaerae bacterium]|jgi:hypothetical protein|nr:hypothetical protein [Lentisphaerota bacterium]MBT4820676.1 hypothetical protein [Lentisphaerota bacterium]MBT5605817.1 hypothetical protein [Lentisphaerota bacterium]MBT7055620.1 hypothetical protein [Lentisphaerota bacterium]MBT7846680.1 hypothetical protein [Lentisphaerota bacterium]
MMPVRAMPSVLLVSLIVGLGESEGQHAGPVLPDLSGYRVHGAPQRPGPIVTNGEFENGVEGWKLAEGYRVDPTAGRGGTGAMFYERTNPAEYPLPSQSLHLEPGGRYRFSALIRTENVSKGTHGGATLCIQYTKGGKWLSGRYPAGISGTKDWTRVEAVTTVPADAESSSLTLYFRPKATGKAWFDDVTVIREKPRWSVYLIQPGRETIPPDNGHVLLGSCLEGVVCRPPDAVKETDLLCRIEVARTGTPQHQTMAKVCDGRIVADLGKLPEGAAHLRLTLLDTRHRWFLGNASIPVTVARPKRPTPANACEIDKRGRAIVNGRPFLPVGLYHHAFRTREDFDLIAASPFNCIMPYNSLYMRFPDSKLRGVSGITQVLDACSDANLKVIFSIKDVYEGTKYAAIRGLGVEGETAVVSKAVNSFRTHPALLAWYINDELPTSMLDRLTARRREVNRLDPFHPTWAVFCSFDEVPMYGPTCDVVGVDPYPIRDSKSRDMERVRHGMNMAERAVGTPEGMAVWAVPQIMNWACYDQQARKDRAYYEAKFRDPSEHEMLSMSLLCAIQGAKGFIYYSFSDLSGHISATAKPDFSRRWPEVCRMAKTMTDLAPFLLSDKDGPDVTVTAEEGSVLSKAYTDEKGRIRVLVTGIGPGPSQASLTVSTEAPLRSVYGACTRNQDGRYRFRGTDICSDILTSD